MPLIGNVTSAIYGAATPNNANGQDGDIYVQTTTGGILTIWKKESGTWNSIGDINGLLPGWTSFDPSVVSQTGSITSFFGKGGAYKIVKSTIFFWTNAIINQPGTGGGALIFGLPLAIQLPQDADAAIADQTLPVRVSLGSGVDNSGLCYFVRGGSQLFDRIYVFKYDGSTPIGQGNGIYVSGVYQQV